MAEEPPDFFDAAFVLPLLVLLFFLLYFGFGCVFVAVFFDVCFVALYVLDYFVAVAAEHVVAVVEPVAVVE